jgi:hypothetical protein
MQFADKERIVMNSYNLQFSTFFGAASDCRGMCADSQGNIYLAGATWRDGWPTTESAYDRTFHGEADMAISKWSPEGKLIWSTLIGAPGHDRPYTVKVDSKGFVFTAGIGSVGMPTTAGSFQPKPLARIDNTRRPPELYVGANGYVAKLTPDGAKIAWGSFVGNHIECRDLALDDEDNVYMTFGWWKKADLSMPDDWFKNNAFCKTPHGDSDLGVMKVSSDGSTVLWATFIGGTGGNSLEASLCVGPDHCPVVATATRSEDMPTTPGAFSDRPDCTWLGKLSDDGSKLIFGTYIGDRKPASWWRKRGFRLPERPSTHGVTLDPQGNIFLAISVNEYWPVTPGVFQTKFAGGNCDFAIAKFSPTGALLAATYLGGSGDEYGGPDTISADPQGNVLITGGHAALNSTDYPVTPGCFQLRHGGGPSDGVFSLLSNDLSTLLYSSYMGGEGQDKLRANSIAPDGSLWVSGNSGSDDWPTKNAYQNGLKAKSVSDDLPTENLIQNWIEGKGIGVNTIVLAKFSPASG